MRERGMCMKKHLRTLLPLWIAAALTAALACIYLVDSNLIIKKELSDFSTDRAEFCFAVEETAQGRFFCSAGGYCFPTGEPESFYNMGLDMHGEGVRLELQLCLVKEDTVWLLPSTPQLRDELLQLPEAAALQQTAWYNFFAGVQSKYCRLLLPAGSYRAGIVYTGAGGAQTLLLSDREVNL